MSNLDSSTRETLQGAVASALDALNSPTTTWTRTEGDTSGTSWTASNHPSGTTWSSKNSGTGTKTTKKARTSHPNSKLINDMWKQIAKEYSVMTYIVCQNLLQLFVYCVPVQEDARPCDVRFRNLHSRTFIHAAAVFDLWQAARVTVPQLEIVKRDTDRLMQHWIAKTGDRLAAMYADSFCESFMDYCALVPADHWPQTVKDHRFFKRAVRERCGAAQQGNVLLFGYRPLTELADAIDVSSLVALKLATAVEVQILKDKVASANFEKDHRYRKQQFSLTALQVWVLIRLSEEALQCPGSEVPSQLTRDADLWKVVKGHFGDLFGGGHARFDEAMEELKLKSIYDHDFFFIPGATQPNRP